MPTFFKPNVTQLRKDKERIADERKRSAAGGTPFAAMEEGENIVRLIPSTHKRQGLYTEVGTHWRLSPDVLSAVCPKLTFKKPCPVCEAADKLKKKLTRGKDDKWRKLYRKYSGRRQYYYLVIDRSDKKPVPSILTAGRELHYAILAVVNSSGYSDVWDVDKGRDLVINRTGEGIDTTYNVLPVRKRTPLSKNKKVMARIAKECPNLSTALKGRLLTYKELSRLVKNSLEKKSRGKKKKRHAAEE